MKSKVSQFVFKRMVAGVKGLVNVFCLTQGRLDRRHLVEWLSKAIPNRFSGREYPSLTQLIKASEIISKAPRRNKKAEIYSTGFETQ